MQEKHNQYLSPRHGSNSWALRDDLISAFRNGSQLDVPPLSAEWSPILSCDSHCPGCPYNRQRELLDSPYVSLGSPVASDDQHATTLITARLILERLAEAGITGVLFTGGGEPLLWDHLVEALSYSATLGMDNGLYTNGFRLGLESKLAAEILAPKNGLVFVRVSINASSPKAFRSHWGLDASHAELQFTALARLFSAREAHKDDHGRRLPSIQISTVVNHQNVGDLLVLCERLASVIETSLTIHGEEDVMIVRPMTVHGRPSGYSSRDHNETTVIRGIIESCGPGSPGARALAAVGIRLFLGFGLDSVASGEVASYSTVIEREYAQRGVSLATGVFLTVGQDGAVYPSTEHNCDPPWAIGDLRREAVKDIYRSDRRRVMLAELNRQRWGPAVSQPTARTARLDKIARAIKAGVLDDDSIAVIASRALATHRLLLD